MPSDRYLRTVEFVLWVATASAAIVAASLALGLLVGRDLVTGKYVLFVVGFLLFGVGSLLIQPSRPTTDLDEALQPSREPLDGAAAGPNAGSADEGRPDRMRAPDLTTLRNQLGAPATHQHRFEARIQEIGPLAEHPLPFHERIGREYKIFVTSLVVLAFSLGMELVGIHV